MEDLKQIQNKISELKKIIINWNKEYYQKNNPSVDDYFYDQTLKELIKLEEKYPQFKTNDSPSQVVGVKPTRTFKKVNHNVREMLSLKNAFDENDLLHFDNQINNFIDDKFSYIIEPKIDGLSISLNYRNGTLYQAITRGDGKVGEDVTKNVLNIKSIPKKIDIENEIDFRGEIYITLDEFNRLNDERILQNEKLIAQNKKPLSLFANPRNLASGTLRHLDSDVVKNRNLNIFIFQALNANTKADYWDTQIETLEMSKALGFQVNEYNKHFISIKEGIKYVHSFKNKRLLLPYEIDGMVFKINEYKYHSKIGYTTKFPRWAIAYKFPTEIKKTKLLDIFPTVGRTGRITYNAKLKKVNILGTNVQKATLHNASYIENLDIRIGSEVYVKKAGEIIPKVIGVANIIENKNFLKWEEAITCPSCESILSRLKGEVDQYCLNPDCDVKIIESLIHFVSRKAMNIDGFSKQQIKSFYKKKFIKNIVDIYNLNDKKDEILKLHGYKQKSVKNILNSIEKSKSNNLNQLLFGLGIRNIGEKAALDLSKKYKTIEEISKLKFDELNKFQDFGAVKANSIVSWFENQDNLKLIENLKNLNVNTNYIDIDVNLDSNLYQKAVLVTGTLEDANREDIKSHLKNYGAIIKSSPTKDLQYLFVGKNPSLSKVEKVKNNSNAKIIYVTKISEIK